MRLDPEMSEWGNPPREERGTPIVGGPTRGTETSHYPEEKKIRMIPPVAASERGGAQTGGVFGPLPGL